MPLTEKGEEIKKNMEKEYGGKEGEKVFYASKNKGTIHGVDELPGMDAVPIPDCWRTGDEAPAYNSVPLISPTAIGGLPQPNGLHEPTDEALPGPHGEAAALKAGPLGPEPPPYSDVPNPLEGAGEGRDMGLDAYNASLYDAGEKHDPRNGQFSGSGTSSKNPRESDPVARQTPNGGKGGWHEQPLPRENKNNPERSMSLHSINSELSKLEGSGQGGSERAKRLQAAAKTFHDGADAGVTPPPPAHEGCDPAMSFDLLAAMGHGRGVDWSGDVSGLPKSVSQEQMVNFAASMNFGEGVTK